MSLETASLVIEQHSIEEIPDQERHGKPWNLFTLWFASNVNITCVITGAVAVYLGLNLTWAIISVVAGNLIGGVFMAYHSIQGPRMGLPQMIQSRAQFGSLGAILPMIITVLMYLGFQIEGGIALGEALAARTGLPVDGAIVLFGFIGMLTALFGYWVIHILSKVTTVVFGIIFAAFFIKLTSELGSVHGVTGHSTWQNVLLAISISVSWQVTWAPYVSDYSRYLPKETPARRTFWYTYSGSVLTASITMMIGVFAAVVGGNLFSANPLDYLTHLFSGAGVVIFWVIMIFGLGGASGPYGAFLTAYAAVSGRPVDAKRVPRIRAAFVVGFIVLATVLAIAASTHLLATYANITTFLLYLLVPWTAINLTDYFVIRRGHYDIPQLLNWHGKYGLARWRAVLIYFVAIAIQVPFIDSSLYEGPIAKWLGGADIAWLVGLAFSAAAYYIAARNEDTEPAAARRVRRKAAGSLGERRGRSRG
jgi:NCS1 family nucleobase:cation symporter-1